MPDSVSNGTFIAYLADDGDTKAITYTGTWAHLSSGLNESYLDTGSAGNSGSQAALTFKGEQAVTSSPPGTNTLPIGSIIAAVAAIPNGLSDADARNAPNVSFVVDGGAAMNATVDASNNTFMYINKALTVGQHTVTLTILEQTDAFPFVLDVFVYAGPDDVTVPIGDTQPLSDDGSAGSTGFLNGLLPDIEKAENSNSGPPVGPIVGGVIGGLSLIGIVSLVVWYLFVRPRRRGGRPFFYAPAKISDILSSEIGQCTSLNLNFVIPNAHPLLPSADTKPQPYPLTQPTPGAPTRSMSQVPSLAPTRQPTYAQSESELEQGLESVSGSSGYGYGAGMGANRQDKKGPLSSPPPATYHADSGIRFTAGGSSTDPLTDVPPMYSSN